MKKKTFSEARIAALKEEYVKKIKEDGRSDLLANNSENGEKMDNEGLTNTLPSNEKDIDNSPYTMALCREFFEHGYLFHNPLTITVEGKVATFAEHYNPWKINKHLWEAAMAGGERPPLSE